MLTHSTNSALDVRKGRIVWGYWELKQHKCTCPLAAAFVKETSSGLRLLKVGLKKLFCPFSLCARGDVLFATNGDTCRPSNVGQPCQTHGGRTRRVIPH
jgi:hypothetical protein